MMIKICVFAADHLTRLLVSIPVNVTADSGNMTSIPVNVTEDLCCAF